MARQKRELHFITKVINNISFTSHKYEKGKYLITAKGYKGERWIGYNTWEKRNDGDMTDGRSSFSPKNKRWFQVSFEKIKEMIGKIKKVIIPKLTDLYPMPLLLVAPKTEQQVIAEEIEKILIKYNVREEMEFDKWHNQLIIGKEIIIGKTGKVYEFPYSFKDFLNQFVSKNIFSNRIYKMLARHYNTDNGIYANKEMMMMINDLWEK